MALAVLDVDNVEGSRVSFTVDNGTDTTQISTSGDHAQVAGIELDVIGDLGCGNVQLDGVISLDDWIRVTDGATIVCHQEWHVLRAQCGLLDLAQLVL